MRDTDPTVTIQNVSCSRETDKALLCCMPDGQEIWIPKSHVHDDSEVFAENGEGKLVISEWLAQQKGLA